MSFINGAPWSNQNQFNSSKSGSLTSSWTGGLAAPYVAYSPSVVFLKGYVHIIGGLTSSTTLSQYIQSGTVGGAGVINSWTSTVVPSARRRALAQPIVIGNYLYLIGGRTVESAPDLSATASILRAEFSDAGLLGGFISVGNLPVSTALGLQYHRCAVVKNKLYVFGGSLGPEGSPRADVLVCDINEDGSLGTWSSAGNLAIAVEDAGVITTKTRVYLVGGANHPSGGWACQYSDINVDGSLGAWTTDWSITLPTGGPKSNFAVVTSERAAYLIGGNISGPATNKIVYCAISTAGVITAATVVTSTIASNHPSPSAVVTSSRCYCLGSQDFSLKSTTYTAWSGGFNDYTNYLIALDADGSVIEPNDSGSGSAVIYSLGYGSSPGQVDEVSCYAVAPDVGFGVTVEEAEETSGYAETTTICYGAISEPVDWIDSEFFATVNTIVADEEVDELSSYAVITTCAYANIVEDVDQTEATGSSYLLCTGVVIEQEDDTVGSTVSHIAGYGATEEFDDELYGEANVVELEAIYGDCVVDEYVDLVIGTYTRIEAAGSLYEYADSVSGIAPTHLVCTGYIREYHDVGYGLAYCGGFISYGNVVEPIDYCSGTAIAAVLSYGNVVEQQDSSDNAAYTLGKVLSDGSIYEETDQHTGTSTVWSIGSCIVVDLNDVIHGATVVSIACSGLIYELDYVSGQRKFESYPVDFEFARCAGVTPSEESYDYAPIAFSRCSGSVISLASTWSVPYSFSRCGAVAPTTNAAVPTPYSFSRCSGQIVSVESEPVNPVRFERETGTSPATDAVATAPYSFSRCN